MREEILVDFTGDALANPQFLETLATDNPFKFRLFVNEALNWIKAVAQKSPLVDGPPAGVRIVAFEISPVTGYAVKQDRLVAARSIQERSMVGHMCFERLPNDCPQVSVLLSGESAALSVLQSPSHSCR